MSKFDKILLKNSWLVAGAILLLMFLLAFFSSRGIFGDPGDSGTVDEIAHIPSGYSYVKYGDFRLNPEHPPLAKVLAGIPLALKENIKGISDDWSWAGLNQWESGWFMLYEAGNDPAEVLFWARLPMMLLMIFLGAFLFKWAKEIYGSKVAILTLLLFALYPDILAHGRLVTTDIAAATGFVISVYYFAKALDEPSRKNTVFAGIAFGIAQLLKFSSFLLFGVLLILVAAKAFLERTKAASFFKQFGRYFTTYFLVCAISLVVVWIVYIPFVINTPPSVEHEVIERNLTADPRTEPLRNFLHNFEDNTIARALGHYLLGVMLVIGRVEGGNATYILGNMSDKSISWYFPVAWLLKTPLTIIALSLSALALIFWRRKKAKEESWLLWLILTPVAVYWAFTLKGSLNIGIRHLMPTVPFVLLLIGYLLKFLEAGKRLIWQRVVYALIFLMAVSTLTNFPNFIAYFNELTPKSVRHERLIDSSLDWGQDLLRLKQFVDENKIDKIKVDYFGGSVPAFYIPTSVGWHSEYGPTTGWLAISATFYQSSKLYGEKEGKWSYHWLDGRMPKAIIGGSILVYNITDEDLLNNPPTSPYPITKTISPASEVENKLFEEQKR